MTALRIYFPLAAWSLIATVTQMTALHWGLPGCLLGSLLCGILVSAGERVLALESASLWLVPAAAAAASLLGVAGGVAASDVNWSLLIWSAPLLAAAPSGFPALRTALRNERCSICRRPLGRLLSFRCPRCKLRICENCWEFERERCRLCEVNQIPLLSAEVAWWKDRLGETRQQGACSLCLTPANGNVPQWACRACGHNHCRSCWDDTNGRCSRCGWTLPDLPGGLGAGTESVATAAHNAFDRR